MLGVNSFTTKDLASILEMLEKHDVTEFKLERGEEKLFLRRGRPARKTGIPRIIPQMMAPVQHYPSNVIPLVNPVQAMQQAPSGSPHAREGHFAPEPVSAPTLVNDPPAKKSLKEVTSPMVGTFYRRPAVDAEPYVSVGDVAKKGDVLCIVEAMKLMNEIESDTAGKIVEICLEDGQMVEYGEVLFRIEPL